MIRRALGWVINRAVFNTIWRFGGERAMNSALGAAADVVPKTTQRSHRQIFNVTAPPTIYVRGSHCNVTIQHHADPKVILDVNLHRAFGVELVAEQDDAGIYIVAKRKAVVGKVTRADLTLTIPSDSHLALHLTPGEVTFTGIDGMIELPTNHIFTS
ncbi:MAG: hypothetical protein JXA10_07255 [Anaerolineae bacterium]|nr:hypothetical protein [Anaerolineae bacterium]